MDHTTYLKDYIVFDLETTGFGNCEIIEIGAIKVINEQVADTFSKLIKPERPIPYAATMVNGITNEMVRNAERAEQVLEQFLQFSTGAVFVGHNIASFDMPIIRRVAYNTLGVEVNNDYIDTMHFAKRKLTDIKNYKLGTLCEYFNIDSTHAHRALKDCYMTMECYMRLAGR